MRAEMAEQTLQLCLSKGKSQIVLLAGGFGQSRLPADRQRPQTPCDVGGPQQRRTGDHRCASCSSIRPGDNMRSDRNTVFTARSTPIATPRLLMNNMPSQRNFP